MTRPDDPIAPNVVQRHFADAAPNAVWVTDVTCVWTQEGWLYLAAILDLCSRRIVGWATSANNDTPLALAALARAKALRKPLLGLVHHSDRGSVYASGDYRAALKASGAVASMSRSRSELAVKRCMHFGREIGRNPSEPTRSNGGAGRVSSGRAAPAPTPFRRDPLRIPRGNGRHAPSDHEPLGSA